MSGKGIIGMILGALGWVIFNWRGDPDWKKVSLGAFVAGLLELLGYVYENRKQWRFLKLHFVDSNRKIRITTAYLFRIERNGKYLLIIRNKKDMVGYTPVV